MSGPAYHLRLSEEERQRYRGMARAALAAEGAAWARCGVTAGARVVDLGCGPGAVLVELARLVGPAGSAVGVDRDDAVLAAARELVAESGVPNAEVTPADATATGLEPGGFDVVMIRHVLAHNGPRVADILRHAATLLRPGGHVWAADVAVPTLFVDPPDPDVAEAMRRYRELHARAGNDLDVGPRLGSLLAGAGLEVVDRNAYYTVLSPFPAGGGPVWAAREALLAAGLATTEDLRRWQESVQRLADDPTSAMFACTFTAAGRRRD